MGVRCHDDEVYAKLVIIAEGSNTVLLEKAGLTAPTDPSTMAVGVKRYTNLKRGPRKSPSCCLAMMVWHGSL